MAAFKAASFLNFQTSSSLSSSFSTNRCKGICTATISALKFQTTSVSIPLETQRECVEKLDMGSGFTIPTLTDKDRQYANSNDISRIDPIVAAKFHAVMEAVADRVEMHRNIGEQRDNWNRLLVTSINTLTLGAATMVGLAATVTNGASVMALKLSSTLLYLAATGILVVMNKLQPSQLAEEQRNAARLFKQLHCELRYKSSFENPNIDEIDEAMEKVLALDKAYPLPLLGSMIEKFPTIVEPAIWWPQQKQRHNDTHAQAAGKKLNGNGWNRRLENEMRQIIRVIKREDLQEYLRLSRKALQINKILAVSGPLLTLLAAVGSAFMGCGCGAWAVMLGVVAGPMASVVNTMEHGGQIGMVFEMYRSNAGFFKLMEQTIESNINVRDVKRRENGQVFEMKVALQLGRTLSELRQMAASSSSSREDLEGFASKLF